MFFIIVSLRAACKNPNTFVNGTGGCECLSSFPFGDPYKEIGCWNCDPPCDTNAKCVSRNTCVCNDGYVGDGLDICEKPTPVLADFFPKFGSSLGGDMITFVIRSVKNYSASRAFCRFGPVIVDSVFVNSTHVVCLSRINKPGFIPVAVGFDTSLWSKEKFLFEFRSSGLSPFTYLMSFFVLFIFSIVGILIYWLIKKNRGMYAEPDEILPLNKWHMNQPIPNPSHEKSCLDFLWNIILE